MDDHTDKKCCRTCAHTDADAVPTKDCPCIFYGVWIGEPARLGQEEENGLNCLGWKDAGRLLDGVEHNGEAIGEAAD